MERFSIWANTTDNNAAKSLMSGLKMHNQVWHWQQQAEQASIWCVNTDIDDLNSIRTMYKDIAGSKPFVIFLGRKAPKRTGNNSVFFRSPLNLKSLHQWLDSHQHLFQTTHDVPVSPKDSAAAASEVVMNSAKKPRWKIEKIKISKKPRSFEGDNHVMTTQLYRYLMKDWRDYYQAVLFCEDEELVSQILQREEKQGNIVYEADFVHAANKKPESGLRRGLAATKRALHKDILVADVFSSFSKPTLHTSMK